MIGGEVARRVDCCHTPSAPAFLSLDGTYGSPINSEVLVFKSAKPN